MRIKHGFEGERFVILPHLLIETVQHNPLVGDLFMHSLGYFSHAIHHHIDRPKGCGEYLFIYCTAGTGWVVIGDKRYAVTENHFLIIPPNTPHSYGADEQAPWTIYWVHFTGRKAPLMANGFAHPTLIAPSSMSRIEDRLNLFEEIYGVLSHGFTTDNINYANLCFAHFLGTFIFLEQFRETRKRSEYSSNVMNIVTHYMNENIANKLSIRELADSLGYSESYFYRLFVRETGRPPIEYFTRLKINKACDLLLSSDMRIVQIAHTLGFNDSYYFTRTFTRIMGLSPLKYRKLIRQGLVDISNEK